MSLGMRLRFCAFFCVFLMLTACGDDSSTSSNDDDSSLSSWSSKGMIGSSSRAKSSSSSAKSLSSSQIGCKTETEDNCEYGELVDDRDGQTYKTVKIGDQVWMAENLNYEVDSSFCYNDSAEYCEKYGRLYRWAAAIGRSERECGYRNTCYSPSGLSVCPSGWHLPSMKEWGTLFNAVGGSSTAGKMLKSTSGWNDGGNGTDAFGFSAFPAGRRIDNGYFENEGGNAYFWSSTDYYSLEAYLTYLYYNDGAYQYGNAKYCGYSVRCIKN